MTRDTPTSDNARIVSDYARHKRHDWGRAQTREVRGYQLGRIAAEIPDLATASETDLVRWHDGLTGSADSVAQYTSLITGLYTWMTTVSRLRVDNPSAILRRPRIPRREPRPMLDRHYELALACALSHPEMYVWLGLMGCSGFRCCEVAWCRVHDFEARPDGGAIARIIGKGGKRRSVPIGAMLFTTMRPFLAGRGHVFTRPNGEPHSPKRVSQQVNEFLAGLGITETAHSMRHRFGTDYHAIDSDLYRQAKIMGHASVDTTQLYTEVDPIEAAKYIEELTQQRLGRAG